MAVNWTAVAHLVKGRPVWLAGARGATHDEVTGPPVCW
jgi:hypothetical protein